MGGVGEREGRGGRLLRATRKDGLACQATANPGFDSVRRSDTGDFSAFGMNAFELLGELVEGHVIHAV